MVWAVPPKGRAQRLLSTTRINSRCYPFFFFKITSHVYQQETFTSPRAYKKGGGSIIYGSMSLHYIQPDTRSFETTVVLPYKSGSKSEQDNYATY